MTTLIADSGSTKTNWLLIENDGKINKYRTEGINPVVGDSSIISHTISKSFAPKLNGTSIDKIFFYGAGCTQAKKDVVEKALAKVFPDAEIEVQSDVLAAARALCGYKEGVACIIGTGSNSCLYNGKEIVRNISPLGYILGDESSGAVLGNDLIGNILKKQLPEEICHAFFEETKLTEEEIIDRVYRKPFPNRFLASLSPFLAQNLDEPCIRALVLGSFKAFLKRNVMQYENYHKSKVHFIGSVAFYYKTILAEAAQEMGIQLGTIIKSPMEGLIEYHK